MKIMDHSGTILDENEMNVCAKEWFYRAYGSYPGNWLLVDSGDGLPAAADVYVVEECNLDKKTATIIAEA
jgi:hypothetical protein